jgi:hypothetical protein
LTIWEYMARQCRAIYTCWYIVIDSPGLEACDAALLPCVCVCWFRYSHVCACASMYLCQWMRKCVCVSLRLCVSMYLCATSCLYLCPWVFLCISVALCVSPGLSAHLRVRRALSLCRSVWLALSPVSLCLLCPSCLLCLFLCVYLCVWVGAC